MRVVSWNMGCAPPQARYRESHSKAWPYLLEGLQPDVCLFQEALYPDTGNEGSLFLLGAGRGSAGSSMGVPSASDPADVRWSGRLERFGFRARQRTRTYGTCCCGWRGRAGGSPRWSVRRGSRGRLRHGGDTGGVGPQSVWCSTRRPDNNRLLARREADGWFHGRQKGSHRQFHHPTKPGTVTVAGKPSVDVPPGTLNSILKQAGLKK
jgi:predicted RNA binding protein YcfA (HicA-like mRNA interferase family)